MLACCLVACIAPSAHASPLQLRWATTMGMPGTVSGASVGAPATPVPSFVLSPPQDAGAATPWPWLLHSADAQAASNLAANAGVEAALGLSEQAWASAWMPRLDLSASASQSRQKVNNTQVDTPTTALSLGASLPLWRAAERAQARAQSAQVGQAQWQARLNRTAVRSELSGAYLAAVELAEQSRLTLAQQHLLQEQLRINERRLQAGVGTVLDVLETRTRVDQARAALQDLDTRLATQRLTLERLGRQRVQLPAGLNDSAGPLPEVVPPLLEALAMALAHNPAVQEAQAQIDAAKAIDQARSAEFWQPTLDAVASASRVREVPKLDGVSQSQTTTARSLGLQLNWALYTGGVHQGRTREAAGLLIQAQARQDEAQAQVETSLRDAYQSLAQAREVIEVQRQVEQSASATFEALRKAFVAGMRTNLDLLNAQQQIYAARQSVVSAHIKALSAQVSILAALDQLDATHIAPLTTLFDNAPLPQRLARTP